MGTDQDDRIQDLSTTTHLPLLSSWDIPLSDGKNEDAGRLVDMIESNKSKACFAIGLKPSIEARIQSILSFYPGVETINAKLLDVTKHTGLELMESVSSDLCEDSLALLKQLSMCREIEAAHNSASFLKKGAMMGISTDEGVDIAGLSHQLRLLRILSSYKFETSNTRLPAMAHPSLNSLLDIKCSLSRLARKSGNLNLSKKVLTGKHDASFGILYERSKLAHSCGKLDQSVSLLLPYFESQASLVREAVGSNSTAITLSHGFSCIPKSLICIAKWSHSLSNEIYQRAFDVLKTATVDEGGLFADKSVFGIDLDSMEKPIATRSLSNLALELAVQGFPLNARAWYDYANYFYIQGREILEKIVISISSNEHFVELVPLILEEGGEKKTADVHNIHWVKKSRGVGRLCTKKGCLILAAVLNSHNSSRFVTSFFMKWASLVKHSTHRIRCNLKLDL